jgi:hypothetical protein
MKLSAFYKTQSLSPSSQKLILESHPGALESSVKPNTSFILITVLILISHPDVALLSDQVIFVIYSIKILRAFVSLSLYSAIFIVLHMTILITFSEHNIVQNSCS